MIRFAVLLIVLPWLVPLAAAVALFAGGGWPALLTLWLTGPAALVTSVVGMGILVFASMKRRDPPAGP